MGSRTMKAAAVNLLVTTQRRDMMSKQTATASTIEISATTPTLMLALELGEESWKQGVLPGHGWVLLLVQSLKVTEGKSMVL